MGTGVIFYEEIAEDIVQTWDQFDTLFAERLRIRVHPTQLPFRYSLQSFLFDPDRPYDLPIFAIRPDRGVSHPSPPRHPPVPPPFGPSSSHYSLGPDYVEIAEDIVQTWDQFDTLFAERLRIRVHPTQLPFRYPLQSFLFDPDRPYDLPISVPAQMEADPVEDPMDTNTGEDEDPEEAEQSEDSEDTRSDERSVVSTDTCESRA
ncbi:hypothetical protein PIB30_092283 [Stylosanthes scabra]|uniref:Uncharacterized protein n=1 Tax=Stylosanthes scabra TaxID=79078 RepID=A0ABU6XUH7_9FABA|nr:hypothetical protein [Stylosanthes scabra]